MNLNKLRGVMAERNVRQSDIAKLLSISEKSVSAKINGKVDFKVSELNKICTALKVEPEIFLANSFRFRNKRKR